MSLEGFLKSPSSPSSPRYREETDRIVRFALGRALPGVDMLIVVVGGNGQLGHRCCMELARRGHNVRALVRRAERMGEPPPGAVEVVTADSSDPSAILTAMSGADAVLLTANSAVPRAGDRLEATQAGMQLVVAQAQRAGVRRFCLVAGARSPIADHVPLEIGKRTIEGMLHEAAMESVVLRLPPFMEVWLALVGSSVPLRGEPHATVGRPSPFLRRFRHVSGSLIERRGVMLVPGSRSLRNAFIAIPDVARACSEVLERPDTMDADVEVGGPEVLTWEQVAQIYSDVLNRPVRIMSTPAAVYSAAAALLSPVSPVASATMALNRMAAVTETLMPAGGGLLDPGTMTTVRRFLEHKVTLQDALPEVP